MSSVRLPWHISSISHRQGLGTLQRTLHRIDKDLEGKTACVALDKECIEVVTPCTMSCTCVVYMPAFLSYALGEEETE